MTRKKISPETQARILAECRRRCALCSGLNGDLRRKTGQIAHLDREPKNDAPENLVFFCLEHHDEYDSTTSQAKGITAVEVRRYFSEMRAKLEEQWERGEFDAPPVPRASSPLLAITISNSGGAGGPGGLFAGGGGGGGAPLGSGGAGGNAPILPKRPKPKK
jgi:hypothetical protein